MKLDRSLHASQGWQAMNMAWRFGRFGHADPFASAGCFRKQRAITTAGRPVEPPRTPPTSRAAADHVLI
jgi:hypothetical protein